MVTATTARSSANGSRTRRAVLIIIGLIVMAIVVALLVARGGDDSPSAGNDVARIPVGEVQQVSAAQTTGAALPRFDDALAADPAVGAPAPILTASYFDGADVVIDPSDGQPRVLLFLAHWCPHCQAEVRSITEWFETNGPVRGVQIVAISTSVDEGAANFPPSTWFARERWITPVLRDSAQGDLAAGYGLSSFPYVVVTNGDGEVVSRSSGSMDTARWESLLASAAAG